MITVQESCIKHHPGSMHEADHAKNFNPSTTSVKHQPDAQWRHMLTAARRRSRLRPAAQPLGRQVAPPPPPRPSGAASCRCHSECCRASSCNLSVNVTKRIAARSWHLSAAYHVVSRKEMLQVKSRCAPAGAGRRAHRERVQRRRRARLRRRRLPVALPASRRGAIAAGASAGGCADSSCGGAR